MIFFPPRPESLSFRIHFRLCGRIGQYPKAFGTLIIFRGRESRREKTMTQYIGKPSKVRAVCFDEENKAKIETLFAKEIAAKKLEIDWDKKEYVIHADWGTIGGIKGDWIVLYKPGDIASGKADAFGSYMPGDEKDAYRSEEHTSELRHQ